MSVDLRNSLVEGSRYPHALEFSSQRLASPQPICWCTSIVLYTWRRGRIAKNVALEKLHLSYYAPESSPQSFAGKQQPASNTVGPAGNAIALAISKGVPLFLVSSTSQNVVYGSALYYCKLYHPVCKSKVDRYIGLFECFLLQTQTSEPPSLYLYCPLYLQHTL